MDLDRLEELIKLGDRENAIDDFLKLTIRKSEYERGIKICQDINNNDLLASYLETLIIDYNLSIDYINNKGNVIKGSLPFNPFPCFLIDTIDKLKINETYVNFRKDYRPDNGQLYLNISMKKHILLYILSQEFEREHVISYDDMLDNIRLLDKESNRYQLTSPVLTEKGQKREEKAKIIHFMLDMIEHAIIHYGDRDFTMLRSFEYLTIFNFLGKSVSRYEHFSRLLIRDLLGVL
jgi:hypothetical protein